MTPLILLCGERTDSPLDSLRAQIDELGFPYVAFGRPHLDTSELDLDVSGKNLTGELLVGDIHYPLESFSAIYNRLSGPGGEDPARTEDELSPRVLHRHRVCDALNTWFDGSSARVVNRPRSMGSNGSKPYQLQLIQAQGFAVPETIVTNDPDVVLAFWRDHTRVVYKSVSSYRSVVSLLRPEDRSRLEDIVWCPTQFQRYINGLNVRVHTVGTSTYASAVVTPAVDYRYADREEASVHMHAIDLPVDVSHRCVALAHSLELPVSGIDLKIDATGAVYCLEVNPSPAFTYYEHRTGQPIGAAIAWYLATGGPPAGL